MLLQINKESRLFALTHYTLCFGSTFQPPSVYFNFILDTLYLPGTLKNQIPHFFGILSDLEMQKLRYLAISAAIFPQSIWDTFDFTEPVRRVAEKMTDLKNLMILYSLSELMSPRSVEEDMSKEMEFMEELPDGGSPGIYIRELPREDDWSEMGFDGWEVRKMRPVYGWRGEWPVDAEREWRALGERVEVGGAQREGTWDGLLDFALEGMVLIDPDEE